MAIHPLVLHNGEIRPAGERMLSPGQIGLLAGWGVFSTLRVADGALFAWDRHWARMSRDARLINVALPFDPACVERNLMRLVEANGHPDCTMRVVAVRNSGGFWEGPSTGQGTDLIALTADLNKWSETVRLGIQPNARYAASEFSGAKVLSWAWNLTWVERAHDQSYDEVVLLNEREHVSECTSANIFAVSGNKVVTPPLSEGCLPGITRELLLEAELPEINIREQSLRIEDLYSADEVFITSTTRGLVPVAEIAGRALNRQGKIRTSLMEYLNGILRDYVTRRKALFAQTAASQADK